MGKNNGYNFKPNYRGDKMFCQFYKDCANKWLCWNTPIPRQTPQQRVCVILTTNDNKIKIPKHHSHNDKNDVL